MHHSEQKCAHFCSEWCIVGQVHYGICEIGLLIDCGKIAMKSLIKDSYQEVYSQPFYLNMFDLL